MEGECLDSSCHEDATCIVMGPGLFNCECNGDLVGDGITACDNRTGPKEEPSTMDVERDLKKVNKKKTKKKKEKKKKCTATPSASPSRFPSQSPPFPCFAGDRRSFCLCL